MRRRLLPLLLAATLAVPARALAGNGFELADAPPVVGVTGSPLSLVGSSISSFGDDSLRVSKKKRRKERQPGVAEPTVFSAHRAAILLRSLTVPGWGQATVGRRHAAAFFGTAELGIWTAFTAFRIQEALRAESYQNTARLFAGIDVSGRDEEFRRIVGAFSSSDQYNLLVVARDAANLYMTDPYHPNMPAYWAYIAQHSLTGSNAWHWSDEASFARYRTQRKQAQRAAMRANTALSIAIVNRLVSAAQVVRGAGRGAPGARTSWNIDVTPGRPGERVLFRTGLSARF